MDTVIPLIFMYDFLLSLDVDFDLLAVLLNKLLPMDIVSVPSIEFKGKDVER